MELQSSGVIRAALAGSGLWTGFVGAAAAAPEGVAHSLPTFAFSGAYAGLNIGGSSWNPTQTFAWSDPSGFLPANLPGAVPSATFGNLFPSQFGSRKFQVTFGAQVGYNMQVENFLYGLEADINTGSSQQVLSFSATGSYLSSSTSISTSTFLTSSFNTFGTSSFVPSFSTSTSSFLLTTTGTSLSTSTAFLPTYTFTPTIITNPSVIYTTTNSTSSFTTSTTSAFQTSLTTSLTTTTAGTTEIFTAVTEIFTTTTTSSFLTSSVSPIFTFISTSNTTATSNSLLTSTPSFYTTTFTTTGISPTSSLSTISTSTVTNFNTSTLSTFTTATPTILTSTTHPGFGVIGAGRAKIDWINTIRTRFGIVQDRTLFYVTGGLAIGSVSQNMWSTLTIAGNANSPYSWSGSKSSVRVGYALGAGVETALSDNVTVRGQFLYYNLGTANYGIAAVGPSAASSGITGMSKTRVDGYAITLGVNYLFGTK